MGTTFSWSTNSSKLCLLSFYLEAESAVSFCWGLIAMLCLGEASLFRKGGSFCCGKTCLALRTVVYEISLAKS